MILENEKKKLFKGQKELESIRRKGGRVLTLRENRIYFDALRSGFRLFEDVVYRANKAEKEIEGADGEALRKLVGEVIHKLGGVSEPNPVSLKDYDHNLYGPFLGVSDEGSAARAIRRAALTSPKMKVLGPASPIMVGVAHDAERLAAVGEVAVGPEEYRDIILDCQGSILISTNVGTRLNLRYYKQQPIIKISGGEIKCVIDDALHQAQAAVKPFWKTPDGLPRPITLFASFSKRAAFNWRLHILKAISQAMKKGGFCDPNVHNLGLFATVGYGGWGIKAAKEYITLAKEARLKEVAIEGVSRWEAQNKISMPGLLNYFSPSHVEVLLRFARENGISITPKNMVDPDTVARNVWSSLQAARNMGLHLGKYGLFPLTFEESNEVMGLIQRWFPDWTAAPVFYIDFPHLSKSAVYTEKALIEGVKKWLDIVAGHKIPVVLIDTADKDKGRKLFKRNSTDRVGILNIDQISVINQYALKKGIRCLWAGGVTLSQAFELGKLKVFGIYVTTSVAAIMPVSAKYKRDPMLTAEKEPTYKGVYGVKLILEAGFLTNRLHAFGLKDEAVYMGKKAIEYIKFSEKPSNPEEQEKCEQELATLAENAWKTHFKRSKEK